MTAKYPNQCGYIEDAIQVALVACKQQLSAEDLGWLLGDLESSWEDPTRLPENALRIGSGEMYNAGQSKMTAAETAVIGARYFLKAAAFFFLVDAIQEVENKKRETPIALPELARIVTKKLKGKLKVEVEDETGKAPKNPKKKSVAPKK